jgi:hypothetical protein
MKKILFISLCQFVFTLTGKAQMLQLNYSGSNIKIIESVKKANEILADTGFYNQVNAIREFDNTVYSGHQILAEMKSIKTVEITEYFKRHTRTTAKTQTKISINTAKLNRSLASIVNTLVHESIHAADWLVNRHWNYTHKTQYEEIPPISAPYIIGSIAEGMVNNPR